LGFGFEGRLLNNSLKCHDQGPCDTLVFSKIHADGLPELHVSWGKSQETLSLGE
jgi:hypothetical protein